MMRQKPSVEKKKINAKDHVDVQRMGWFGAGGGEVVGDMR